jgi:D-glycero-D-manno-heptose 1,7-bisphosphate phosphatase
MIRAIFTDKDGVLNKCLPKEDGTFRGPYTMDEVEFFPNVKTAVDRAHLYGYNVFVVSNQPSNEWPSKQVQCDFLSILSSVLVHTFKFDGYFFALDRDGPFYKPQTGMIDELVMCHDIDKTQSWMIGDRWRDAQLAENAKVNYIHINGEEPKAPYHYTADSFFEAVDKIILHDVGKEKITDGF